MEFVSQIKGLTKSEHATAALYVFIIGLALSDIIPTPGDALYFYLERNLRDQWKNGKITPQKYWELEALYYYSTNFLWWTIIFLVALYIPGTAKDKFKVAIAVIGAGMVIGVLFKNVEKDKIELQLESQVPPKS